MDYISREKLQQAMYHEAFETDTDLQKWESGCWIRYKLFENVIEALPAADVVERKVGKWIIYDPQDIGTTNCRCSNCRTEFFFASIPTRPYAYCPACGARMEN